MASKSKTKGSTWERDVAAFLSSTYGQSFTRVPNSGAYIGGKNSIRMESLDAGQIRGFKGDIIPPSDWVSFNCEAKNYQDFPFHQVVLGNVPILDTWISQCLAVAHDIDFSFIVFKITRKGKYIAFKDDSRMDLSQDHFVYSSKDNGKWIIMGFDSFFNTNKEIFKALCSSTK